MTIRLAADIQSDSIVDGEGIRSVIWTQGCPHHCLGCQNPSTWDINGGDEVDVEDVCERIDELEGQSGITFSGGDPFFQSAPCAYIAKYAKEKGYNIWAYTGYVYEDLLRLSETKKEIMDFLKQIDVLVDGRFVLELKSYNCIFRGSSNQRIIDVPKSLKQNKTILVEKYALNKDIKSNRTRSEGIYI